MTRTTWRQKFENPSMKYRMKSILHAWPKNPDVLLDALEAFGYGGTATNPSFQNGYTANPANLREFGVLTEKIKKRGLNYWIYDENGYPSGYAGGQTLEGHPELEAKGFYMVRKIAYERRNVRFDLDGESDRIIWAAKYPLDCTRINSSIVEYEKMEPVPFSESHCECLLEAEEVMFVFCVKPAYEGTHCVHNVCSHSRYINIMNPEAVKRFLEINYEPILRNVPEAYGNAEAVFTDEPSLMIGYIHGDETWPYALAPWTDGLFEAFEAEYGFSLLPYLPMIFEGRQNAYWIRVKFYELVGKLTAKSYVRQISDWCRLHGTIFSGHYLAEESLQAHVVYYGNYLTVLKETDYPGADILASYPAIFHYNTPKYAQMAARKNGAAGVMVELCPFINMERFEKNPLLYARGILNLMFLGGCRKVNSYFSPDFAGYAAELADYRGYIGQEESRGLNEYVGRLAVMLEDAKSRTRTFVYYAIEEAQAKTRPSHLAIEASDSAVDRSLNSVTRKLLESGEDYLFCDKDDLVQAARRFRTSGICEISGIPVENIVLPAMDVIYGESWEALKTLQEAGVHVYFAEKLPKFRAENREAFAYYDFREESALQEKLTRSGSFAAQGEQEIVGDILDRPQAFQIKDTDSENDGMLLKAAYEKEGKLFYFVVNNREEDVWISWKWADTEVLQVWDPQNGEIRTCEKGNSFKIRAYQGVFCM